MVRYGLGLLEAAMTMTRQWGLITSELTSISPTSVCDPAVLLTMSTFPGPNVSRHSFHASYVPDELRMGWAYTRAFAAHRQLWYQSVLMRDCLSMKYEARRHRRVHADVPDSYPCRTPRHDSPPYTTPGSLAGEYLPNARCKQSSISLLYGTHT